MQDIVMFSVAVGFGITVWLLLVLSEWLLGDKPKMSGSELVRLLLSVGLLVYLVVALLKPEWFA